MARRGDDSIVLDREQPDRGDRFPHRLDWYAPAVADPRHGLVPPVYWLAWLNRRTFAYDALALHATKDEWKAVFDKHRGKLLCCSACCSACSHTCPSSACWPRRSARWLTCITDWRRCAANATERPSSSKGRQGVMDMNFGAIIIEDEISPASEAGQAFREDRGNAGARGLRLSWVEYPGDDRTRLTETFRRTLASGDVVFSCGGIGNTPDDHTRQAVAAALGVGLEISPEGVAARSVSATT